MCRASKPRGRCCARGVETISAIALVHVPAVPTRAMSVEPSAAAGERAVMRARVLSAGRVCEARRNRSAQWAVIVGRDFFGVVRAIENLDCRSVTRSAGDVAMRRGCRTTPARYPQDNAAPIGRQTQPDGKLSLMELSLREEPSP